MDPLILVRGYWVLFTALVLIAYAVPALNRLVFTYGARGTSPTKKDGLRNEKDGDLKQKNLLVAMVTAQVPHGWFWHFYLISVLLSMIWMQQLFSRGPLLQVIISRTSLEGPSMSFNQLVLCWSLLAVQGSRRLYECMVLAKPSTSQMWIGHYVHGLLYYFILHIAVWIEGAPALNSTSEPLGDAHITAPSLSTLIFLPIFLLASGLQHDCHFYLSSLRKYELPSHAAFLSVVSPHYTAECAIYLAFTFIAAPEGRIVNRTLLCVLAAVLVSLGIPARFSKDWYAQKFGTKSVEHKWCMIPGIW